MPNNTTLHTIPSLDYLDALKAYMDGQLETRMSAQSTRWEPWSGPNQPAFDLPPCCYRRRKVEPQAAQAEHPALRACGIMFPKGEAIHGTPIASIPRELLTAECDTDKIYRDFSAVAAVYILEKHTPQALRIIAEAIESMATRVLLPNGCANPTALAAAINQITPKMGIKPCSIVHTGTGETFVQFG